MFLVLPNLDLSHPTIQALSPLQFYSAFDISVRTTHVCPQHLGPLANSLEDLTRRENRIAHDVSGAWPMLATPNRPFPSLFWRGLLVPQGSVATPGPTERGVSAAWTTMATACRTTSVKRGTLAATT